MTSDLVMGQRLLLAATVVTFITLEKSIGIINVCFDTTVTTSHMIDQGPLALASVVAPLTLEVQFSFSFVNRLLVLVQEGQVRPSPFQPVQVLLLTARPSP